MKDKIEQLYISAIQGEWDSAYFAERMMELIEEPVMLVTTDPPTEGQKAELKKHFDTYYNGSSLNVPLSKPTLLNSTTKDTEWVTSGESQLLFWTPYGLKTSEEYKIYEENENKLKLDLNIPI
jgi:hypothetical protein